ncbi:MAG: flagellar basal body P-ring protein FlgI [Planctomycetaceae bacterium]|jgi:flagellar P-ring protein precursor FlgI|nr:flagellar basal body P-ring protein FlgI [Planctomycetaceae bacterium]
MKRTLFIFGLAGWFMVLCAANISAELTIGTVSHVKGQETNTLHGFGIVVGLKGTGDKIRGFRESGNSLLRMLELCGHTTATSQDMINVKNVALVSVMVTVPGAGAREGTLLDCQVAALGNASSLEGGRLLLTSMLGPKPSQNPLDSIIYGQASGDVILENKEQPNRGRITGGCRLEDDFFNPYVQDGVITLVIDEPYANFSMAYAIESAINDDSMKVKNKNMKAKAINQNNVTIPLPPEDIADSVKFLADILNLPLTDVPRIPTVIINESAPSVAIDADVEILPTTVSHGGMTITIPALDGTRPPQPERFANIDPEERSTNTQNIKLRALQESLNAVNVPTKEIITIIKMLDAQGSIQGKVMKY